MPETTCEICGRKKASKDSYMYATAEQLWLRCHAAWAGDQFGEEARCYRLGHEREKARADEAEARIVGVEELYAASETARMVERNAEMQAEAWKLEEALAAARRECEGLRGALSEVVKLIDEGVLVRNVFDDGKPGWAMKSVDLVIALKNAAALAAPGDGEEGKHG